MREQLNFANFKYNLDVMTKAEKVLKNKIEIINNPKFI
jgi:hypothetical protein